MKPLEALKRIRQETCPATILPDFDKEECCNIIETALKRLENYEQNEDFNKDVLNYGFLNEKDKIEKLKAFEILKRTGLDINWFKNYFIEQDNDFEVYDDVRMRLSRVNEELGKRSTIAPSEFELLKRVLK